MKTTLMKISLIALAASMAVACGKNDDKKTSGEKAVATEVQASVKVPYGCPEGIIGTFASTDNKSETLTFRIENNVLIGRDQTGADFRVDGYPIYKNGAQATYTCSSGTIYIVVEASGLRMKMKLVMEGNDLVSHFGNMQIKYVRQ